MWLFEQEATGPSLSLINAIESNNKSAVEDAIRCGADVNATVGESRNTPLHLSIRNKNEDIAALLLKNKASVNVYNKLGRTPLHEACRVGNLRLVKQLTSQEALISACDHEHWTPLHYAAEKGHKDVVECLLAERADINVANMDENTPLHIAAMFGHEHIAELLIDKGADAVCFNSDEKSPVKIMTENSFDSKFFFRVISLQTEADILAQMNSPIRFVNQIMKEHRKQLSFLANEVYLMLRKQNPRVVRYLLVWFNSIKKAARSHGHEKIDLFAAADLIEAAVNEIFACDSMDTPRNVQRVLQPDNPQLLRPSGGSGGGEGFEGHSLTDRRELFRCQVTAFRPDGVLSLCLRHNCKFVFGRQQVSGFISTVFRAPARAVLMKKPKARAAAPQGDAEDEDEAPVQGLKDEYSAQIPFIAKIEQHFHFNIFDPKRFGLSYSLRSTPVAMFGLELISKIITLMALGTVAVGDYGRKYELDYHLSDYDNAAKLSLGEYLLIFLLFSNLAYELGQLAEGGWSVAEYMKDEWNILDSLCNVMLVGWFVARVLCAQSAIARIILALVAIPESSGALRYLSVSKTLGVIVSTSKAMFYDLLAFLMVYIVCVLGFGIFFFALFYGSQAFKTVPQTMSSMFQFTVGNFDFEAFDSTSSLVNALAQLVLAVYLILTAILLMNLLIARMTNAYQRVDDKAVQEWSFAKTQTVLQYLLLRERNVLCMLPSPFNLITAVCYPLQGYFMRRSGISFAGTLSNLVLAYIGGPIRVYSLFYCFRNGVKAILRRAYNRNKQRPVLAVLLMVLLFLFCSIVALYLTLHVVFFYPLFAWSDLIEHVQPDGTLSYISAEEVVQKQAANSEERGSAEQPSSFTPSGVQAQDLEMTTKSPLVSSSPSRPRAASHAESLLDGAALMDLVPDPSALDEEDMLFSVEDINRILRALGSNNIDTVLFGMDLDHPAALSALAAEGEGMQEVKTQLAAISVKLDSVVQENRELQAKVDELKGMVGGTGTGAGARSGAVR